MMLNTMYCCVHVCMYVPYITMGSLVASIQILYHTQYSNQYKYYTRPSTVSNTNTIPDPAQYPIQILDHTQYSIQYKYYTIPTCALLNAAANVVSLAIVFCCQVMADHCNRFCNRTQGIVAESNAHHRGNKYCIALISVELRPTAALTVLGFVLLKAEVKLSITQC